MRRILGQLLTASVLLAASGASAASHLLVEGILKDGQGILLSGTFDITFALYAAETGGTAVYTEVHTGTVVEGGLFQERLGKTTSLTPSVFTQNASLWLGVKLSGQPELPRTPLETNPFAFRALNAAVSNGLDCTGCINATQLGSTYAASTSAGGAATSALQATTALGLSCTGCVTFESLAAGVLEAENIAFDDQAAQLGATTVQAAINALKALLDAGGGGGGGLQNEGNGQVASSTASQWQIGPFASVKDYIHLFNPATPKVIGYFYGTNTSSFATGNNLAVAYNFTPNQYSTNIVGKAGESVMQVGNPGVFTPGSHILLYQSVGTGGTGVSAGVWELNAVKGVAGSTVQLAKPLTRDFTDAGPSSGQAQAVVAVSYNNLEVLSGGTVVPSKALDQSGESGGIVYIRAQNVTVRNGGKIQANAAGFQGTQPACPQRGGSECSAEGPSANSSGTNNCSGGGGSTNTYCSGGGGGNKTAGGAATLGSSCSQGQQGKGGAAKGVDDSTQLHFGGAGGGNNNWCAAGGVGGGIVVIGATNVTVDSGGVISANGTDGTTWNSGGGAGGTVALFASNIVNNGTIEAKGGLGKGYYPNDTRFAQAGNGGDGWIIQKPPPPGIVNEAYPKHVQIWIDGVNVTPSIGDPNGKGAPMYSTTANDWGDNGLVPWETGPLDLTNVANWTLGEHSIELKETGGAGGELKSYVYVLYPYSASTPPANDVCATPTLIDPNTQAVVVSGTTEDFMGKTLAKDDLNIAGCGGLGGPDVVYQINLTQRSLLNAVLVAPFSSKIYLRKANCQSGALVQCSDKQLATDPIEAGTYFLVVDSDSAGAKGNFKLAVSTIPAPIPAADTCAGAQKIVFSVGGTATVSGTTLYANDDLKGLCAAALTGGPDVVYELDAGTGQNFTATINAPFATVMYLVTSQCGASGVPLSCSATGTLTVQGLAGGKYWLVVDGKQAKEWGAYTLNVEVK